MNNLPDSIAFFSSLTEKKNSIAYERVLYGNARSAFTSSASPHIIMGHSGSISPPILSMIAVTLVFVTDVIGGPDSDMRPSVDRMHSEKNVRRPLYMRRAVFVLDATI